MAFFGASPSFFSPFAPSGFGGPPAPGSTGMSITVLPSGMRSSSREFAPVRTRSRSERAMPGAIGTRSSPR